MMQRKESLPGRISAWSAGKGTAYCVFILCFSPFRKVIRKKVVSLATSDRNIWYPIPKLR